MKQTFEIPDGCNRVTIEQQGNKIVTTFEPEFKDGDITCTKNGIHILKNIDGFEHHYYCALYNGEVFYNKTFNTFEAINSLRHATEPEKQQLFDALAKEGKQWNSEKKCIEDIEPKRWRAKYNERCWIITDTFSVIDQYDIYCGINDIRYEIGNYFKTKEQAEEAVEKMKELLKQINP